MKTDSFDGHPGRHAAHTSCLADPGSRGGCLWIPGLRRSVSRRNTPGMTVLALALLALSACGTKGDLECPRGTVPQIDGTCRPPPPAPPPKT